MTVMQSPETLQGQIDITVGTRVGPGFAQVGEFADYLQISPRRITVLMSGKSLFPNRAGRFAWEDVWWKLWRVRNVPAEAFGSMTRSLLTNADVAEILGVHERSIRRDGDRNESRYELPAHLDLSERIRRHHPLRIQLWRQGLPVPSWLEPVPAGQGLALAGRKRPVSSGSEQVSDKASDIGQYDKHHPS
jgi:hypothetical protein